MKQSRKKPAASMVTWIVCGCVGLALLGSCLFIVNLVMSPAGPTRKDQISTISLLKPPPPPPREKLPEPKPVVKKQDTVKQFIAGPARTQNNAKADQKPAGKQLGLDAKGTAGSDSFGLVGNKGGAGLIGGGGGGLGSPFGSYGRLIETELDRKIKKRLEGIGGIPKGKFQVLVQIDLSTQGKIVKYRIVTPSGNAKLDKAVNEALQFDGSISEPPPEGMPRGVNIRISAQG